MAILIRIQCAFYAIPYISTNRRIQFFFFFLQMDWLLLHMYNYVPGGTVLKLKKSRKYGTVFLHDESTERFKYSMNHGSLVPRKNCKFQHFSL